MRRIQKKDANKYVLGIGIPQWSILFYLPWASCYFQVSFLHRASAQIINNFYYIEMLHLCTMTYIILVSYVNAVNNKLNVWNIHTNEEHRTFRYANRLEISVTLFVKWLPFCDINILMWLMWFCFQDGRMHKRRASASAPRRRWRWTRTWARRVKARGLVSCSWHDIQYHTHCLKQHDKQ